MFAQIWQTLADIVRSEGSSRPVSLLRIALPAVMWAEWGNLLRLNQDLGPESMAYSIAFFVFTPLMVAGVWSRATTFICGFLLFYYYYRFGHFLKVPDIIHHHTYFLAISTLLLSFTPCGGSYSFDRWWANRKARAAGRSLPPERGPLWVTALMGFQVSMVYFWGAYQKSTVGFISGFRPQQIVMHHYTGSDFPPFEGFVAMMLLVGAGTVALEYGLAFGLWVRKLQPFLIPAGILFHWSIYMTLPVGTFSVTTCLIYLVFIDPDVVHRFLDRLTADE